jgi:hypothetical protein
MPAHPIVPAAYAFLSYAIPIVAGLLLVISIVTIIRAQHVSSGARVGWTAVVVLFPVVGSTIWLLHHWTVRREQRRVGSTPARDATA